MIDVAALAPPVAANAALARTVFSGGMFNVAVTNVPGSRVALHAFGALVREIHPVLPLLADHAVGIAALSYNGLVTFGITADASSIRPTSTCSRAQSPKASGSCAPLPDAAKIARASPDRAR